MHISVLLLPERPQLRYDVHPTVSRIIHRREQATMHAILGDDGVVPHALARLSVEQCRVAVVRKVFERVRGLRERGFEHAEERADGRAEVPCGRAPQLPQRGFERSRYVGIALGCIEWVACYVRSAVNEHHQRRVQLEEIVCERNDRHDGRWRRGQRESRKSLDKRGEQCRRKMATLPSAALQQR
jgi:hypothetical protein